MIETWRVAAVICWGVGADVGSQPAVPRTAPERGPAPGRPRSLASLADARSTSARAAHSLRCVGVFTGPCNSHFQRRENVSSPYKESPDLQPPFLCPPIASSPKPPRIYFLSL